MGTKLLITGPRKMNFEEYEEPTLKPNEVRLKTLFSGISHGTEMTMHRGTNPYLDNWWDKGLRLFKAKERGGITYPTESGYEDVGKVVESGKDVKEIKIGDIIYGGEHHSWTHRTSHIIPGDIAKNQKMPPQLDPILGIFFPLAETALNGVLDTQVNIEENVAIFGMGTMGQIVSQLIKNSGARVIAVDRLDTRLDLAKDLGADVTINTSKKDVGEEIKKITNGKGADVCIEASGSYDALHEAIRSCAYSSRVIALGFYQGAGINLYLGKEFHHNRINIVCSQIAGINPSLQHRWNFERLEEAVMTLLLKKKLRLNRLVTHKIRFKEAPKAFELIDKHPEKVVQVVLTYD